MRTKPRAFAQTQQSTRTPRHGFSLTDLMVMIAILGVLIALLLPAIQAAREAARRNQCGNNMKQLGLALHGHHDAKKALPLLSTAPTSESSPFYPQMTASLPGTAKDEIGYGWIVKLLPFLEETVLYNQTSVASKKFTVNAFATTITATGNATNNTTDPHLSMLQIRPLRCPNYGDAANSAGYFKANGFSSRDSAGAALQGAAVSNYAATAATHIECMKHNTKNKAADQKTDVYEPPNGIIIPATTATGLKSGRGLNFKAITDGLSKTIMVAETREPNWSSWFDGTVNWVVALNPNDAVVGSDAEEHYYVVSGTTSLNVGPAPDPAVYYRPATTWKGTPIYWAWGPSSFHPNGVVNHLHGDGAVRTISDDVDPTLYVRLVSRAGGENLPPNCGVE